MRVEDHYLQPHSTNSYDLFKIDLGKYEAFLKIHKKFKKSLYIEFYFEKCVFRTGYKVLCLRLVIFYERRL